MSCSDKIARWLALGVQGGLLSNRFDRVDISRVIVGDMVRELRHCSRLAARHQQLAESFD
jgi:hypothetical protein